MASEVEGLLVKLSSDGAHSFAAARALGRFEPILDVPAGTPGAMGFAAAAPATWVRIDAGDNPWDRAHALMAGGFGAAGGVLAAEPDIAQDWTAPEASAAEQSCDAVPQTDDGGRAIGPGAAWHLDDRHSGLATARGRVSPAAQAGVTIAHLDTGYDPDHRARPANLWTAAERNFTKEGDRSSARDRTPPGGWLRNRGHGTGTIGILAGGDPGPRPNGATGPVGGIPGARVLPIRIADSVVRFTTASMVQGFAYALASRVDVVSMSMGGLASAALADAINRCYEAGIVLVAAAGNNFARLPIASVVYPARMRRVIAATGVMANGHPYAGLDHDTMEGCYGPADKMATAIAGWTPNIPWPVFGCGATIRDNGEGTSAATPQVAAAAALWIAQHRDALGRYSQPWMRGEAARQALLRSAKLPAGLDAATAAARLGAGALDAVAVLAFVPPAEGQLVRAPVANAGWALIKLLTGRGVGVATVAAAPSARMLGIELMQISQVNPEIEALLGDPDAEEIADDRRSRFLHAVRDSGAPSRALALAIDRALGVARAGPPLLPAPPPAPPPAAAPPLSAARRPVPAPPCRRLRIFALDPSLGGELATFESKVATVDVRYEPDRDGNSILLPGPVGEYLEVVDVDPASDQYYPPVDLDDPRLLAQDGLEPSEGNPQFHQQMVYAVAMRAIASFEKALGRRALWLPRKHDEDGRTVTGYVQRLRIYPHALRAANAYYSPDHSALLFGYFPAESARTDTTAPGTMVFGCLSADIVAHETTHALLDGYARGYREPSNPDVGAFHEAFADVVAMFHHFGYRDLVRREIALARGKVGAAALLGGLALQFGQGTSQGGPLRDYLNMPPDASYATTFEVHARGALLVKAIYDAFLAIVERRTGDLIRLATGGSGLLPDGAIHPDLVERLTDEACKAASHVLRMCIRTLDYLPPTDITFGGFLRGLITADLDQVDNDRFGYRTAFLECFRRLDLLPPGLRTVSIETLRWRRPNISRTDTPDWLQPAIDALAIDWRADLSRATIFARTQERCANLRTMLAAKIAAAPEICPFIGLVADLPRYDQDGNVRDNPPGTCFKVRSVRAARRQRPDGTISEEIVVVLAQRRPEPLDGKDPANGWFWFRGGATIIIAPGTGAANAPDSVPPEVRYVIAKRLDDADRLAQERAFRTNPPSEGLRALYFGDRGLAGREPFAALHASED